MYFSLLSTPLKVTSVSCQLYYTYSPSDTDPLLVSAELGSTDSSETTFTDGVYLSIPGVFERTSTQIIENTLSHTLHVVAGGTRPAVRFVLTRAPTFTAPICTVSGTQ